MPVPLTFIDLFCGCGGFTLGLQRAGFRCLAAIDFYAEAVSTLRENLSDVSHVLNEDLTLFRPEELEQIIGSSAVDVIVGGPPCQGFSTARKVDGANHGLRLKEDSRRYLYRQFLRYVYHFQPKIFVMENVPGIRTTAGGQYFTRVQSEARSLGRNDGKAGYRVHAQVEDAWELGVPQRRQRQLIVGVRNDLPGYFPSEIQPAPRGVPHTPLGAAIGDLPALRAGTGANVQDYDKIRRQAHLERYGSVARKYLFEVLEIRDAKRLTGHVARPHNDRDLRDFARLREGENAAAAMRKRQVQFEFPYDRENFKDKFTRQSRKRPCSTIVAHLSKDGLMFIHPTQNRSLTPREAARVQSFPDWFRFPSARTHAFRLIGNAVPPLVSEAVGLEIKEFLVGQAALVVNGATFESARCMGRAQRAGGPTLLDASFTTSRSQALRQLERIARLDRRALRQLPKLSFLQGWYALLFLLPGLHPDGALDHGDDVEVLRNERLGDIRLDGLLARRHMRSGWPVALGDVGWEARRRLHAAEISEMEFYCVAAQRAGMLASRGGRGHKGSGQLRLP